MSAVVIGIANIVVEVYKAYIMNEFQNKVKLMQKSVADSIIRAVGKFNGVMMDVSIKAKAIGTTVSTMKGKQDAKDVNAGVTRRMGAMLLNMQGGRTVTKGAKTEIEVAGNKIFEINNVGSAAWARDVRHNCPFT